MKQSGNEKDGLKEGIDNLKIRCRLINGGYCLHKVCFEKHLMQIRESTRSTLISEIREKIEKELESAKKMYIEAMRKTDLEGICIRTVAKQKYYQACVDTLTKLKEILSSLSGSCSEKDASNYVSDKQADAVNHTNWETVAKDRSSEKHETKDDKTEVKK